MVGAGAWSTVMAVCVFRTVDGGDGIEVVDAARGVGEGESGVLADG